MRNKTNGDRRKKSFYIALYAGIGAVMVLALVITFAHWLSVSETQGADYYPHEDDYVPAGAYENGGYQGRQPDPSPSPLPTPSISPPPPAPPSPTPPVVPPTPPTPPLPPPPPPPMPPPQPTPPPTPVTFTPFTDEDYMLWPVYGYVVMPFSQDRLIFNETLHSWRTNDDVRIESDPGTPVRTAAPGQVMSVGECDDFGNYVHIYNGNGWETIIAQLSPAILVREGDIVQTGQIIGTVGSPTLSSYLDGYHVSFRVFWEDELFDPAYVLQDLDYDFWDDYDYDY